MRCRGLFQNQVRVSHAGDRAARRDSNVAELPGRRRRGRQRRILAIRRGADDLRQRQGENGSRLGRRLGARDQQALQTNMTPARSTYAALEPPRSMDVPPAAAMFLLHGGNGS